MSETEQEQSWKNLPVGARHHRAYVSPPESYDIGGAYQFALLVFLGLREWHYLLDVGCGSLRGGRFFISYLLPGRYHGIEPNTWLVRDAIEKEIGEDMVRLKKPVFSDDSNFTLSTFGRKFDFILAQSIFSHASKAQIRRCLSEAKKVMKPESIFAATFVEGDEDYEGDEWVYPGEVSYTFDTMRSLAEEQGFACVKLDWPHAYMQQWVAIVHPENLENLPAMCDAAKVKRLERELEYYRERLQSITTHPYVKLGLKVNSAINAVKRWCSGVLKLGALLLQVPLFEYLALTV